MPWHFISLLRFTADARELLQSCENQELESSQCRPHSEQRNQTATTCTDRVRNAGACPWASAPIRRRQGWQRIRGSLAVAAKRAHQRVLQRVPQPALGRKRIRVRCRQGGLCRCRCLFMSPCLLQGEMQERGELNRTVPACCCAPGMSCPRNHAASTWLGRPCRHATRLHCRHQLGL